jgi:hypothetical protein
VASVFLTNPDTVAILIRFSYEATILSADWYFGDISFSIVSGSVAGIVICAQASLITIDNSTAETDFL